MGSSGGPGAAVAASFGVVALGTDTQGSIVDPSNVESLVGLRSTQDLLPLDGVLPLYVFQDVVGPMCRTAADLARVMEVIDAGHTNLRTRTPYTRYLQADALRGKRIGFVQGGSPRVPAHLAADPEVHAAMQRLTENLGTVGAEVVPLPLQYLADTLYAVANAQSAASCGEVGQKNGFNVYFARETAPDAPVKSLSSLVAQYQTNSKRDPMVLSALQAADAAAYNCSIFDPGCEVYMESRRIQARLNSRTLVSQRLDYLVYATMSQLAPLLYTPATTPDLIQSFLSSTSGQPSITVPVAYSASGVPIGATFLAEAFHEPQLVQAAFAYQSHFPVRRPPTSCPPL
jgi:amidase